MKEYLSPGVYTLEYDKSFLLSAPAAGSCAVFIGGFTKGRAFIPMMITDTNDLLAKTGLPNGKYYSQYAAYEYSKHKGNFWVQRLLWDLGIKTDAYMICAHSGSATGSADVLAILMPAYGNGGTGSFNLGNSSSATFSGSTWLSDLKFLIYQGATTTSYTLSAANILGIDNVISDNPLQTSPVYLFAKTHDYTTAATMVTGSGYTYNSVSIIKVADFYNNTTSAGYSAARTPYVCNQFNSKLFYFQHLSDGTYTNKDVKISIQGLDTNSTLEYSKFDVLVRDYSDTDRKPVVLLAFYGLDLNPISDNYISKRIGDAYSTYDATNKKIVLNGDFPNVSKYVRVVTSDLVKGGFIPKLASVNTVLRIPYATNVAGIVNSYPTGIIVTSSSTGVYAGYNTSLNLIKYLSNPTWETATGANLTFTGSYTIPFYGGFDGRNPKSGSVTNANTLYGFDMSSTTATGYTAFTKALDMMKNELEYDIDMISMAGINLLDATKKAVFTYALLNVCLNRGDCIVLADAAATTQMNAANAVLTVASYDSSFGAAYYPAVKIKCSFTKTFPVIPVSTLIPAVIAYTAVVSQPHYAPAGINRGTLNCLQAVSKLNKDDRDLLYKYGVNPIATFANNGTVVWGQKTLQKASSALDRLNVRILINRIKKWVLNYGKSVLFDNNTTSLRALFTLGVENYLNSIVAANGLYEFKFQMDLKNNTADVIDRNVLIGEVWLKPTKAALFIVIPINIVRSDTVL